MTKATPLLLAMVLVSALTTVPALAHTGHGADSGLVFDEALRAQILGEWTARRQSLAKPPPPMLKKAVQVASTASAFDLSSLLSISPFASPAGSGTLMYASCQPFKPFVRYYSDSTTFYMQSDNGMSAFSTLMPNRMVGITSWQQQIPIPTSYFASATNPENGTTSLGYKQPNYWRLPLVPMPSASPLQITSTTFTRGAIAVAANGIAIFNPHNNTGRLSYEIGELDTYGGHCGLADDYHYHIVPTHLSSLFGGPLGNDVPLAWSLDGYPYYGYLEPDGSAQLALDVNGGHSHGAWGYHYHAPGTTTVDGTHPYGTPASPYTQTAFYGTVVYAGTQVDGQPEVGSIRASGTGGYTANPVSGASIIAFMNPVALTPDGSGNLQLNSSPSSVSLTGCTTTTGGTTITCASTSGVLQGMVVTGTGIPTNAYVTSVASSTQFAINQAATATNSSLGLTASVASADQYLMRVAISGTNYDECWQFNRTVSPPTVTVTWRLPGATTTTTYANVNNRITPYPMAGWSMNKLPDTSQTLNVSTAPQSQDSNYTVNAQSFTDNGDGTITDNVTGLMWQKVDNGESLWPTAVSNAAGITTGGHTDWRLPTPAELQSIQNYNNNQPALNTTYFTSAPITLTNCTTTNGSTTVTCASTAQLSAAVAITGTNIPTGAKVSSVTNSTTFVLSQAATGSSSSLTLTCQGGDYWWTSDPYPYTGSTAATNVWCVNAGGGVGPKPLTGTTATLSAGGTSRYCARYVRGAKPTNGHNYLNNNDGTITDTDTGLMWTQVPGPAMSWNSALSYASGLAAGGYSDWRMPNVKEMGTLTDYTLTSATSSTGILPSLNRQMFVATLTNCSTTSGSTTISCASTTGLQAGMPIVDYIDVSGTYVSGTTPPTVTSILSSTSFSISSTATGSGSGLTLAALAPPTAYWTSSVVAAGTLTQAWLVETGINNSVPAGNGPTRNAQGIISYETFASTYPVFAVRNTSVASQIAVQQPSGTALSDGVSTVSYGNVNVGSTSSKTFTILNNGTTSLTISGVTIDGTNAANFSVTTQPASSIAAGGSTTMVVQFNASSAGGMLAGLHIASSDTSVGAAFDLTLSGTGYVPPPTVTSVATTPSTVTNGDTPYVTATITPSTSATISQAQITYSTGAQTTGTVFYETMGSIPTVNPATWTGSGGLNTWTITDVGPTGDVAQSGGSFNHTTPISLTGCATTSGSPTVTCASTASLWPGMIVAGTNIATGTTVSSITNSTTFVLSANATGTGTGLALSADGVTLTNCATTSGSTTVTCANTSGLVVGMPIIGTGIPSAPNPATVASISSTTTFLLSANATATNTGLTLTTPGCALVLNKGDSTYTDTMATTTNSIPAAGTLGTVQFYVQTQNLISNNGWTMQLSPDGGTTWNTRAGETYATSTVNLTSGSIISGTTAVTCASTTGLVTAMAVSSPGPTLTAGATTSTSTTVTCASTTGLLPGMVVTGSGIPNNATVSSVTSSTQFVISIAANATASGLTITTGYLPTNATVASNTDGTHFVLNTNATITASSLAIAATTINHGYTLFTYNLAAGELVNTLKVRFQLSGYSAVPPAKPPQVAIDDISLVTTTGLPPVTVTMYDDGQHGDGAAGDGVYGVQLPAETTGTTMSYTITATDSNASQGTGTGSYTVVAASPVLAVTPSTAFSSSGTVASGSFIPASASYTLSNTGVGPMTWTATKTANWLTLSSSGGTLAAGNSTTVTASINTVNANSLSAATYTDTISFANTTNGAGNATRSASLLLTTGPPTAPPAPVLGALAAYSSGTSKTIAWQAVSTATGYTVQIATNSGFTANVVTQTLTSPTVTFTPLSNGVTYYYRVLASNAVGSSSYSNTVSSTQDTLAPSVVITSPAANTPTTSVSTATNTLTITGTSSDNLSGIASVTVNNVAATTSNGYATWTATVPLGYGTNAITGTAIDGAGNLATSAAVYATLTTAQTYNPLIIPDVITGTTFNLALNQVSKQFPNLPASSTALSSYPTTTLGYNGALMWGPTLIMNQGDAVQINVTNNLNQSASTLLRDTSTTVHWHGFHIPAVMDGGPRQVIAGGSTWSPGFTMLNSAATYWYHPHLHVATQEQLTLGAGGFIIVRDPQEAALALPRTYGMDDIPLALTSRRFLKSTSGSHEFGDLQYVQVDGSTSTTDNYGDYVLVNGTLSPQMSLPKQYVRLRILNAEIQRGYNLGFSDNRTYYVIGNDQGLLNAPVAVTRLFLMVGERVEILVNLGGDTVGNSIDLKAYNSGQVFGFPGQENQAQTPSGSDGPENVSLLNNTDFNLLHINVAATTSSPITSLPATLANNTYWTSFTTVSTTRTVTITGGQPSTVGSITTPTGFAFNTTSYSPSVFNYTIPINAIERWNISGGNIFGHSIHIHDVKFNIIARTGGTQVTSTGLAAPYESGWKDTIYVPKGETVSVIAQFGDFASSTNPYMFHCHMLDHEDGGLMGQFTVVNNQTENLAIASTTRTAGSNYITFQFNATTGTTYTLQYSPDLSNWTTIGSVTSNGNSADFTETDSTHLSQSKGFYRVVLPEVANAPVISSALTATATHGSSFSYQITASNGPISFSAAGLPSGLAVSTSTGVISGTPATAGTYHVSLIATNAGGTSDAHLVLTVN